MAIPSTQRRGFNLVEAAIVLGVVGLVIGGIWTAASAFSQRQQLTDHVSGVLSTVQNIRRLHPLSTYSNSFQWLTELGLYGDVLPGNWPKDTFSSSIRSPSGALVSIYQPYDLTELAATAGHGIGFAFYDLSNSQCINLVTAITSRFRDQSDLVFVEIGSASYLRSFPASSATIDTNCMTRGGNPAIAFNFAP